MNSAHIGKTCYRNMLCPSPQTWLGLLPNQLVFAALTTGLAACLMPRRPTDSVPLTKVSYTVACVPENGLVHGE